MTKISTRLLFMTLKLIKFNGIVCDMSLLFRDIQLSAFFAFSFIWRLEMRLSRVSPSVHSGAEAQVIEHRTSEVLPRRIASTVRWRCFRRIITLTNGDLLEVHVRMIFCFAAFLHHGRFQYRVAFDFAWIGNGWGRVVRRGRRRCCRCRWWNGFIRGEYITTDRTITLNKNAKLRCS